jgi:hypothetical protein
MPRPYQHRFVGATHASPFTNTRVVARGRGMPRPYKLESVQRSHRRRKPLIEAARPGTHGWQSIRIDVRRPQTAERNEIPVMRVHAGDAIIFVPARAVSGCYLRRCGLVLARPGDDPAGIVAVINLRVGARGSHQQDDKHRQQHAHRYHPGTLGPHQRNRVGPPAIAAAGESRGVLPARIGLRRLLRRAPSDAADPPGFYRCTINASFHNFLLSMIALFMFVHCLYWLFVRWLCLCKMSKMVVRRNWKNR